MTRAWYRGSLTLVCLAALGFSLSLLSFWSFSVGILFIWTIFLRRINDSPPPPPFFPVYIEVFLGTPLLFCFTVASVLGTGLKSQCNAHKSFF